MPRKKQEKVFDEEEDEFEVDEPSEVEELANNATDDDWTPADDEKKPGRAQRSSRARKPVKLTDGKNTSDEDDEDFDDEEPRGVKRKRGSNTAVRGRGRGRGRGGSSTSVKKTKTDENGKGRGKKKTVVDQPEDEDEAEDGEDEDIIDEEESVSEEDDSDDTETEYNDVPAEFQSGKFVLLKSDFDNKEENYPLWKIDGRSLLQKFDRFVSNGEEMYKGTTIYAGWSRAVLHTYYPIKVEITSQNPGADTTVKFDPSQITPEMQAAKNSEAPEASNDDEEEEEEEEEEEATAVDEDEEEPEE